MKLRNLVLGLMLASTVFSAYGKSSSDTDEFYRPQVNVITIRAEFSGEGFMQRKWKIEVEQSRAKCDEFAQAFDKKCGKVVGFEQRYHGTFITYEFLDR